MSVVRRTRKRRFAHSSPVPKTWFPLRTKKTPRLHRGGCASYRRAWPIPAVSYLRWPSPRRSAALLEGPLWLFLTAGRSRRPPRGQHSCRVGSIEIAPFFGSERGRDDVANDGSLALHKIEEVVCFFLDRYKFRHRLATLGDQHRFALGLDFIHDRQTMDFERSRCHLLHRNNSS